MKYITLLALLTGCFAQIPNQPDFEFSYIMNGQLVTMRAYSYFECVAHQDRTHNMVFPIIRSCHRSNEPYGYDDTTYIGGYWIGEDYYYRGARGENFRRYEGFHRPGRWR